MLKHAEDNTSEFYLAAAAFGRLCVETPNFSGEVKGKFGSRLRAAVC